MRFVKKNTTRRLFNRPLSSSKNPHLQNEAKCTTFLAKMSFICMKMKNHFHIKGWALSLVLIQRLGGTRKWPIDISVPCSVVKGNKITNKKVLQKDTAYIVEKHSVFQPAVITDLVEEFIKSCFLSGPTILQKNDHVTYKGVITSFCRQSLLKKEEEKKKIGFVFYAVGNTVGSYCVECWVLFRG